MRRTYVEDKYRDLITALYGEEDTYQVEASVTYRDGRRGTIQTTIQITKIAG